VTDLELLDEQDIEQTKSFLAALIQNKKRNHDRADNHKANMKVSDILTLISNEFLPQTKKMLDGIIQHIATFEAASIHLDGYTQE